MDSVKKLSMKKFISLDFKQGSEHCTSVFLDLQDLWLRSSSHLNIYCATYLRGEGEGEDATFTRHPEDFGLFIERHL
jgi:hypothetical protein